MSLESGLPLNNGLDIERVIPSPYNGNLASRNIDPSGNDRVIVCKEDAVAGE